MNDEAASQSLCWEKFSKALNDLTSSDDYDTRLTLAVNHLKKISYVGIDESGLSVRDQEALKDFIEGVKTYYATIEWRDLSLQEKKHWVSKMLDFHYRVFEVSHW